MTLKIHPRSIKEIQTLSDLVANQESEVWLHSLDGNVMFDVRSLLSLLTFIGQDCLLVGEDSMDPKDFVHIAEKANIKIV